MLKYLTVALEALWNLKFFQGHRHRIFRYLGVILATYQVVATEPSSPLTTLPDIPSAWFAAVLAWISTKGIEFAKAHQKPPA